jgi:hypothetical protein
MPITSTTDIAGQLNLEIYRGTTFDKTYDIKLNNQPWDLSGMVGRSEVKESHISETTQVVLTTSSGLVFSNGSFRVVITATQTNSLEAKKYVWDMLGKENDVIYAIAKGAVIVKERVTNPNDIN